MQNQILKIIFREDKAYLCPMKALTLPKVEMLSVVSSFPEPAYCRVKVVKYQEQYKRLRVTVLSLSMGETDFSMEQKALAYQLQAVEEVRTTNGYNTVEVFKAVQVKKIVPTEDVPRPKKTEMPPQETKPSPPPPPYKPDRQVYQETFYLGFKDFYFVDGGVAFKRRFLKSRNLREAVIYNDAIRASFNAIKEYFVDLKRTLVVATIQTTDSLIDSVEVKSPDVDKIGAGLIETVKDSYVEGLIQQKTRAKNRSKKQMLTMQEFFQNVSDNTLQAAVFYKDDKAFFEDLLEKSDTKHGKHLRYLAQRHEHQVMKLRFLDTPLSFVFLIEGQKRYYIVWETLDTTEATYIWHVHKHKPDLKKLFRRVEAIISLIKVEGKLGYIAEKDERFKRIFHTYTDDNEGFLKWKKEILAFMI